MTPEFPTWVLETNVFSEKCFDEMIAHFKAAGIPYETVRIIPFVHEVDGKKPVIEPGGNVVAYGSLGIQKLCHREGWAPGVWYDPATFNYQAYTNALGDLLLNHDMTRMPLSEMPSYLEGLPARPVFIKPNGDTKEFAGAVMHPPEAESWIAQMRETGYIDEADFDIIVAPVKTLGCEWRAVVVDGAIASCSLYRQWNTVRPERNIIPEVEAVIRQAHVIYQPADVYVIDIAQVDVDGDWQYKVIEYNTFNSAGLYDCDVVAIIDAINEMVMRKRPPIPAVFSRAGGGRKPLIPDVVVVGAPTPPFRPYTAEEKAAMWALGAPSGAAVVPHHPPRLPRDADSFKIPEAARDAVRAILRDEPVGRDFWWPTPAERTEMRNRKRLEMDPETFRREYELVMPERSPFLGQRTKPTASSILIEAAHHALAGRLDSLEAAIDCARKSQEKTENMDDIIRAEREAWVLYRKKWAFTDIRGKMDYATLAYRILAAEQQP